MLKNTSNSSCKLASVFYYEIAQRKFRHELTFVCQANLNFIKKNNLERRSTYMTSQDDLIVYALPDEIVMTCADRLSVAIAYKDKTLEPKNTIKQLPQKNDKCLHISYLID